MVQIPNLTPEFQEIEREHQRNIRIVEARPTLFRLLFIVSLVVDIALLAFFVIVVIGYLISGLFDDLRSMVKFSNNIGNFHAIAQQGSAQGLTIGSAKVLQGTPTSYDFYATIKNPNTDWYGTFTYTFTAGGITSRAENGFVMPGESTYLLSLGYPLEARPASPTVSVTNLVWQRVDRHVAPDLTAWLANHSGFKISTPTYAPDIDFATNKVGRTTFTVSNTTAYGYWVPQFTVILERAGAVVGVSRATITELDAGDVRLVDVRWYGELPPTATATVIPAINYFDEASYMPPRGTAGEDIRDSLNKR